MMNLHETINAWLDTDTDVTGKTIEDFLNSIGYSVIPTEPTPEIIKKAMDRDPLSQDTPMVKLFTSFYRALTHSRSL